MILKTYHMILVVSHINNNCNSIVISWLVNSLDIPIAPSIRWIDTAAKIWHVLHKHNYQGDVFRISDIQEDIYALRQGSLGVIAYFTQLKNLWQELDQFRPLPLCSCDIKCSCTLVPTICSYRDEDCVIRFLKGLNDQYSTVRPQIMMMQLLPDLDRVFSLLIQQKRQFGVPIDDPHTLASFSSSCRRDSYGILRIMYKPSKMLTRVMIQPLFFPKQECLLLQL